MYFAIISSIKISIVIFYDKIFLKHPIKFPTNQTNQKSTKIQMQQQQQQQQDDGGGQDEKADISSLLEVNRLDYRLPPSLSIATSRATKVYRAMESSYVAGAAQMQFTLSSGATYVDFLNSFLRFKVKMPTGLSNSRPKMPAHCGWAQLIRQIRIVHSSGQ